MGQQTCHSDVSSYMLFSLVPHQQHQPALGLQEPDPEAPPASSETSILPFLRRGDDRGALGKAWCAMVTHAKQVSFHLKRDGVSFGGPYGHSALSIGKDMKEGSSWPNGLFGTTHSVSVEPVFTVHSAEVWAPLASLSAAPLVLRECNAAAGSPIESVESIQSHNETIERNIVRQLLVPLLRDPLEEWGRMQHGLSDDEEGQTDRSGRRGAPHPRQGRNQTRRYTHTH
uniref:TLDc domain-containing protein n=1 Tax=Vitrella brassicaformis TaxID=1169539 RepID=A0A7S1K7C0_9ALVE